MRCLFFEPCPRRFLLCFLLLLYSCHTILPVQAKQKSDNNDNNDNNNNSEKSPDESFFLLCSGGEAEKVRELLEEHPEWVHAVTDHGESCLHLTGIYGQTDVTKLLLQGGADPNYRSTFSEGLRMHPLSWNVYGNHYDNAKLLLEAGADVNADFDLVLGGEENLEVVTVLDIVQRMEENSGSFEKIEALLLEHGAKTMADLKAEKAKKDQEL